MTNYFAEEEMSKIKIIVGSSRSYGCTLHHNGYFAEKKLFFKEAKMLRPDGMFHDFHEIVVIDNALVVSDIETDKFYHNMSIIEIIRDDI